jgi:predicted enzyme related to lactoylglutathione lyase
MPERYRKSAQILKIRSNKNEFIKVQRTNIWEVLFIITSSYLDILTIDIDKSVKWYQDNFGFQVLVFNGIDFAMLEISQGKPLFIYKVNKIERNYFPNGEPCFDIGFIAEDMDNLYQKLKVNGIEMSELRKDGEHWTIDLYDPDGNRMCIWSGK